MYLKCFAPAPFTPLTINQLQVVYEKRLSVVLKGMKCHLVNTQADIVPETQTPTSRSHSDAPHAVGRTPGCQVVLGVENTL